MKQLKTLFSSIVPTDCYILKGRLEAEGIQCYMHDENMVSVYPFRAVTIGGVKLCVESEQYNKAKEIITLIDRGLLIDSSGTYELHDVLANEFGRQNQILSIRKKLRENSYDAGSSEIKSSLQELDVNPGEFLAEENRIQEIRGKKFQFNWKKFWYELLDPDGNIIDYFKVKPNSYYIEEQILDNYSAVEVDNVLDQCPLCSSTNVVYGNAIDKKWDALVILTVLLGALFIGPGIFVSRRNYHCFDCGNDFEKRK